ncbi:MAG: hypothetical protein AAGE86_15550 [Pseudomonadota bacterium]
MKVELKTWAGLGLATALVGAGLAGCAGENGEGDDTEATAEQGEAGEGEGGEGEGGEGEGGEGGEGGDLSALPVEQRVVFMAGHVEAGLALYRAGEAEAAAPHMEHPVSETHQSERAGLEKLGFDAEPFEAVAAALKSNTAASEIEPQLKAVEANLAKVREAAGGDPEALIRFLMNVTVDEYNIAVPEQTVVDAPEYQDAWGFAKVAQAIAADLDTPNADKIRATIDELLGLWPDDAPVPPSDPASAGQVSALAARVVLDLPQE